MIELDRLWRRAVTAELCWLDADGTPAALAATPLLLGDTPCVALPYARAGEVAGLADGGEVAFAITDSRSLPAGGAGLAVVGSAGRVDDVAGDRFTVELLRQELVKYPPSRTLADSPLLCRENWWWLPRVIVRLASAKRTVELRARTNPARDALLVRGGTRLELAVAEGDWSADRVETGLTADGPVLAFGYDYSMPDLERWESWSRRGVLDDGGVLVVTGRSGEPEADLGPLPLLRRIGRQRVLARDCRRAIAAAERHIYQGDRK